MAEETEIIAYACFHMAMVCMCIGFAIMCKCEDTTKKDEALELLLMSDGSPAAVEDDQEQNLVDDRL